MSGTVRWAISLDRHLSAEEMERLSVHLREWAAAREKPIVLAEGIVLHDLATGRSYGSWIRSGVPAEAAAAIAFLTFVLGACAALLLT